MEKEGESIFRHQGSRCHASQLLSSYDLVAWLEGEFGILYYTFTCISMARHLEKGSLDSCFDTWSF